MAARNPRIEVTREERIRMRNGDVQTMYDIGLRYYDEGYYFHARAYLRRADDNGFSPACVQLGYMYENGQGGRIDYGLAFASYMRAWMLDRNPQAYNNVAIMHLQGLFVPRNIITARLWFEESAARWCPEAYYNLGDYYESSEIREALIVLEDMEPMFVQYMRSEDRMNRHFVEAMVELHGLSRDQIYLTMAANWYRRALNLGVGDAQEALNRLDLQGINPRVNPMTI